VPSVCWSPRAYWPMSVNGLPLLSVTGTGSSYRPEYGMWFCIVTRFTNTGWVLRRRVRSTSWKAEASEMKPWCPLRRCSCIVVSWMKRSTPKVR
jgi:hypothetical protein